MGSKHRWQRQGWGGMSSAQRRQLGIVSLIQMGLLGFALRDWWKRPASEMRGGNKWKWFPVLFVNFAGPITYLAWGRRP
jgi:hypothetical protein